MKHLGRALAATATATIAIAGVLVTAGGTAGASTTTSTPTLVAIRAAHHSGFDRIVLQFSGGLPHDRDVTWVDQVIRDGSGAPLRLAGHAFLNDRLENADAHTDAGEPTIVPRRTYALPNITQSAVAGDFEGVVNLGIGVQRQTAKHVFTLSSPSRLVIDVSTPYDWTTRNVYFLNSRNYADGTRPYLAPRARPVIPPAVARNALERLFAGPTLAERANGLRFVRSEATGFTNLRISDTGVARLRLTGGCDSNGSTFTVANEIRPTLKQFASVDFVKIYSPSGHTENPTGRSDSIPLCLEP